MTKLIELGEKLKERREFKNKTIDDCSNDLKVKSSDLKVYESGEINLKQKNIYNRLIINKYAKYLNLDLEEFNEVINEIYPNVATDKTINLTNSNKSKNFSFTNSIEKKKKKKKIQRVIMYLISIIIIIFIIILMYNNVKENFDKVIDGQDEVINESELMTSTILRPRELIENELIFTENIGSEYYYTTPGNAYQLEINFSDSTYALIIVDGVVVAEDIYVAQEPYKLEVEEGQEVSIKIGTTENVELIIDGQVIEFEDDTPTVATFIIQ